MIGVAGTVIKNPGDLSPRRSSRAQSLRTFQSTFGFSDASAFSAHSAVKLDDIVILLEKSAVPELSSIIQNGILPDFRVKLHLGVVYH